jgi:hypothetical protein
MKSLFIKEGHKFNALTGTISSLTDRLFHIFVTAVETVGSEVLTAVVNKGSILWDN